MSGHSKWSTIKRKKGAADTKRSTIFSRMVQEISVAVKEGGSDPDANPRLRLAIQNAKGNNMPKDNILRAINKAEKDETQLNELNFEGYLSNGIGVFIECLSDNNNRTVSNIRSVFNKNGGTLGTKGSLKYMFERKGVFTLEKLGDYPIETLELELIDVGAEDIEQDDAQLLVSTTLENFGAFNKNLEKLNIKIVKSELQRIPVDTKKLPLENAKKIIAVLDAFEEVEDVQNVFHNLEITDELLAYLEK